jgi:hypothetical protein
MAPHIIERTKTVIYKIVCKDLSVPELYVGSTSNITRRRAQHKSDCSNPKKNGLKIYQKIAETGGWENWQMVVVEEYPDCESGEQARTREREWYERLGASLNMVRPYRSNAEAVAEAARYRTENREQISERAAQYYVENREQISEDRARYYAENREQISERVAQYYAENREQIAEREARYRTENREQIAEREARYRTENREQISEHAAQYYAEHREQMVAQMAAYRIEHREVAIAYAKKYYEQNRDKISEKARAKYQEKKVAKKAALTAVAP